MSQDELARLAGYTDRSSIAKIEQGSVDLPQSKISMFAKIFRVTPSFLMGDDGVIRTDPDLRPLQNLERTEGLLYSFCLYHNLLSLLQR